MTAEITKALNTPKIKEIWTSNGSAIPGMTGADFGQFVDSEVARWARWCGIPACNWTEAAPGRAGRRRPRRTRRRGLQRQSLARLSLASWSRLRVRLAA